MGSRERGQRSREKFDRDQTHIAYLLAQGMHPIEIADRMTQVMIEALRESVKRQHPDWSADQIIQEMRDRFSREKNLQQKRGLRNHG
jgi:hypothetical protein